MAIMIHLQRDRTVDLADCLQTALVHIWRLAQYTYNFFFSMSRHRLHQPFISNYSGHQISSTWNINENCNGDFSEEGFRGFMLIDAWWDTQTIGIFHKKNTGIRTNVIMPDLDIVFPQWKTGLTLFLHISQVQSTYSYRESAKRRKASLYLVSKLISYIVYLSSLSTTRFVILVQSPESIRCDAQERISDVVNGERPG